MSPTAPPDNRKQILMGTQLPKPTAAERLELKLARLRDETEHPPLVHKPKARTTAVRWDYSLSNGAK